MDNRSLSHTRWKCQYHIVFIPKYRKRILYSPDYSRFQNQLRKEHCIKSTYNIQKSDRGI